MEPLINVIIPVYNVEEYLSKCVNSIINQTYTNLRIILINDGSTDSSLSICDEFAKQDYRIMVINRKNAGQSAARNSGLSEIFSNSKIDQGKYIAFVDSDDYVTPDYIETLYQLLIDYDADISQCGHYIVYSQTRKVEKNLNHKTIVLNQMQALESLCYNDVYDITVWNKLFKINIFNNLYFSEGRIYEDTMISYKFTEKANKIVINMEPKYFYIQRYNSTANGTVFHKNKYEFIQVGDEMADYISLHYPTLKNAANVKRVFVRLSTLSQMVNSNHYDKNKINEMKKVVKKYGPKILIDPKASIRDKLGIICFILGYPCYRIIWKTYYKFVRRI